MQIVIDIPEEDYEYLKSHNKNNLYNAILNGIPLPKGHGRLFDERDIVNGNYEIIGNKIYEVEPIIEADIPIMYYPQVEGVTPTVISNNGSDMLSAEEIDNLLQALAEGEARKNDKKKM